ncbi:hypothetical protein BH10ACI2_BH10ACI2_21500 [soil metagenome]
MDRQELEQLWNVTLRSSAPKPEEFERLAQSVVDLYLSNSNFHRHIKNRSKRVTKNTGQQFDPDAFDIAMARAFIADEIGFGSWEDLMNSVESPQENQVPILFTYAIAAMERGDFSALESTVGGPDRFDDQVKEWFEKGFFSDVQETLAEVFSAACMLGHVSTVRFLLDHGVDPLAGIKTGLNGFHYAASSGRLDVIKLLIERKIPMEIKNMYGGTVFDQAIWSAVNEYTPDHAAIVEALLEAGAVIEPGYAEWWDEQDVPDLETKRRVAAAIERYSTT